ncbi:barstar family protein [Agrobacterium tumefaciens]|uniref:barstar family protein n=1 Tax=Agrobacterium tumefaciens TaxID=358 RepID=UPI0021D14056|nr:barstar family protein [Agrobacterium tumefaciens]UXS01304.1 barstar family protein [Agrobacterium tumefaciens]
MREVIVDCSGIRSAAEFWQRYLDVVKPQGAAVFGCNLDAFWDAIEGGGPGWPGDVALIFSHTEHLSALRTGDGNASFLDALAAIANEATVTRITFT